MSKHTKGPWVLLSSEVTPGFFYVDSVSDGAIVYLSGSLQPPYHNEANARLIAAAPELLEALNHITEVAETYMEYDPDSRFGEAIAAANAAIAKAEGE